MAKYKPGQSGNPGGRPRGSGKTSELRALLEPHAPELVKKAMDLALEGDVTALRLCLERLMPPIRGRDEVVKIQELKGSSSLVEQGQALIDALAEGLATPREIATMMQTVAAQAKVIETDELEKRVSQLESENGA